MKIDRDIELSGAQRSSQGEVRSQPCDAAPSRCDDHLVDMGILCDDRRRRRFNDVSNVGVWEMCAERPNGRGRENDVTNLAEPHQENSHGVTGHSLTTFMARLWLRR